MNTKKPSTFKKTLAALAVASIGFAAQANAAPFVLAYTDGQITQSYANFQSFYSNLSAVGLGSAYDINSSGVIGTGGMTTTTQNIISFAKTKGVPIYPTVSDWNDSIGGFDPNVSAGITSSSAKINTAVTNLVNLCVNNGFAGVDLDFEAVESGSKSGYSSFVSALASGLHAKGMKLIISVPPKTSDTTPDYLSGYDYGAIGAAVDYFQLMTYDEVGPGWSSDVNNGYTWPGPVTGLAWMKNLLNYTVSKMPASKVLEGLPSYGNDYTTGGQAYWSNFNSIMSSHNATKFRDSAESTPYATWGTVKQIADGTEWSTSNKQPALWYDDAQSITQKTQLVSQYNLGGTSVWAMGYEDASYWSAVKAGLGNTGTTTTTTTKATTTTTKATTTTTPAATTTTTKATTTTTKAGTTTTTATTTTTTAAGGGTNIAPSGSGSVWTKNATSTANTNKVANAGINDGNLSTSVIFNVNGEGGAVKWEAAGVTWTSPKILMSAKFINAALDTYGNGFFESGVTVQYTTNGTTWLETGWAISPGYPNSASAAGVTYTATGASKSGVLGVRVSGATGANSWSAGVKEVQAIGY